MPKFNNRENEKVSLPDGREVWLSRHCAVVGVVFAVDKATEELYVALGKRGKSCPDEVGKWVMPSGYLDWDESLGEACLRETWEEIGLDIKGLPEEDTIITSFHQGEPQPSFTSSNKTGDKQNVSHYFFHAFAASPLPELSTKNNPVSGEVEEAKWVNIDDLQNYEVGFNHEERIMMFIRTINKVLN